MLSDNPHIDMDSNEVVRDDETVIEGAEAEQPIEEETPKEDAPAEELPAEETAKEETVVEEEKTVEEEAVNTDPREPSDPVEAGEILTPEESRERANYVVANPEERTAYDPMPADGKSV